MKSILKIVLSLIALGLAVSAPLANAQENKGKGKMSPEERVKYLDETLKLTDAQKAKLTDIFVKQAEKMQGVPKEERRAKGDELRKAAREEIRALLTPEQLKKYDEMPQGPGGKGGEGKKAKKE